MKRNRILSIATAVLCMASTLSAADIYHEIFDGSRTNQKLPSQAAWFNSHLASDITPESGALSLLSSNVWLSLFYFTDTGAKTIGEGESLVFTFTFTAKNIVGKASGFRMAVLNSEGKRVTADGFNVGNDLFVGYTGYGVAADLGYTSDTEASFIIRKASDKKGLLSGGGYFNIGTPFPGSKLTSDTPHTISFAITNNGDSVTLTYKVDATTHTATESNNKFTSFDTVAFQPVNQADTLRFTSLNVKLLPKGATP